MNNTQNEYVWSTHALVSLSSLPFSMCFQDRFIQGNQSFQCDGTACGEDARGIKSGRKFGHDRAVKTRLCGVVHDLFAHLGRNALEQFDAHR